MCYRLERRLLRNVKYFNDVIVTHTDEDYMKRCGGAATHRHYING